MREHQVLTADVQVEARAKQLHAHGAALDVPPGPAVTPRTRPENIPIFRNPRLPEGKVRDRLLLVLVARHALSDAHFFKVQLHQLPILGAARTVLLDAEIYRPIRRAIGQPARDQLFDERDDVPNMLGGARRLVRLAAVEGLQVLPKSRLKARGDLPQRLLGLADALDDFVIKVRDIHHVLDGITLGLQAASDQVAKDECAPIADVREVINRRPAAIKANLLPGGVEWNELLHRA